MNDFQIFEDLHTLAHLWMRYKADGVSNLSFWQYLEMEEPDRADRLMKVFGFIKGMDE